MELVIVFGLDQLLVWVLDLLPTKSQKVLYWIACVIELPHLWVGSCGIHLLDEVYATPLSHRTTKCWSTQQGLACWQACELREKIGCLLPFGILPVIGFIFIL